MRLHYRCIWKLQSLRARTIRKMCPNTPSALFDPVAFAILCSVPQSQDLQEATQQTPKWTRRHLYCFEWARKRKVVTYYCPLCDRSLGIVFLLVAAWAPFRPLPNHKTVFLYTCLVWRIVGASSSSIVINPLSGDLWPSISCGESCLLDSAFLSLNKLPLILHGW